MSFVFEDSVKKKGPAKKRNLKAQSKIQHSEKEESKVLEDESIAFSGVDLDATDKAEDDGGIIEII